jgi:hypothetical protein
MGAARRFREAVPSGGRAHRRKKQRRRLRRDVGRGEGASKEGGGARGKLGKSVGVPTGGAKPNRGRETDGGSSAEAAAKLELEEDWEDLVVKSEKSRGLEVK